MQDRWSVTSLPTEYTEERCGWVKWNLGFYFLLISTGAVLICIPTDNVEPFLPLRLPSHPGQHLLFFPIWQDQDRHSEFWFEWPSWLKMNSFLMCLLAICTSFGKCLDNLVLKYMVFSEKNISKDHVLHNFTYIISLEWQDAQADQWCQAMRMNVGMSTVM